MSIENEKGIISNEEEKKIDTPPKSEYEQSMEEKSEMLESIERSVAVSHLESLEISPSEENIKRFLGCIHFGMVERPDLFRPDIHLQKFEAKKEITEKDLERAVKNAREEIQQKIKIEVL